MRPRAVVYWTDLLASTLVGYAAVFLASLGVLALPIRLAAGILAVLALYRAFLFLHEVAHRNPAELKGFRIAWNLLVGVPLLMPSFFYEGVHAMHHSKASYGTARDPEYFPLAGSRPHQVIVFVLAAALLPVFLAIRALFLAPLAALSPAFRRILVARFSSVVINPHFRRPAPSPRIARRWVMLEIATSVYAWTVTLLLLTGKLPFLAPVLAIGAGIALLNQFRTLAAHHWESEGGAMDPLGQLLDSVNVPPPAMLPVLWAPLGLRYHGLHHFMPGVPYHNLHELHRRLLAALPGDNPYGSTSSPGAVSVIGRLLTRQRHGIAVPAAK